MIKTVDQIIIQYNMYHGRYLIHVQYRMYQKYM